MKNYKTSKKYIGEDIRDIKFSNEFLDVKLKMIYEKNDNHVLLNWKTTVNWKQLIKRQATDKEKISEKHLSNKKSIQDIQKNA